MRVTTILRRVSARLVTMRANLFHVLSDRERKSLTRMALEFMRCCVKTKGLAFHYFTAFLYRTSAGDACDYLSFREMWGVQDDTTDGSLNHILSNKLVFLSHFGSAGLAVPELLGYNVLGKLFARRQKQPHTWELSSPLVLADCLRQMATSGTLLEIFVKPIVGINGINATKISLAELDNTATLEHLWQLISNGSYLFQKVIAQHPTVSRLNASSVNTVRIDTFKAPGRPPEILSAYIRLGIAGSCVDNVVSGGIYVGIDMKTGTLEAIGRGKLVKGGPTYRAHPSSGVVLEGFVLPHFEEVKDLALRAADWLPTALVGWDIAIAASGPILIEANILHYGMQAADIAYGGYRKNPVYQRAAAFARTKKAATQADGVVMEASCAQSRSDS